jgi:hypothetical protein
VIIGEAYRCLSCFSGFIFQINSGRPESDAREQGTHLVIKQEEACDSVEFQKL